MSMSFSCVKNLIVTLLPGERLILIFHIALNLFVKRDDLMEDLTLLEPFMEVY